VTTAPYRFKVSGHGNPKELLFGQSPMVTGECRTTGERKRAAEWGWFSNSAAASRESH